MRLDRTIPVVGAALLALGSLAACDKVPVTATAGGHPGGPGGAPPCAPEGSDGEYGEAIDHPERAPLQAQAQFAGGVRWAVCGASPVFSDKLINLRSDDSGASWTVNEIGTGISPHHAGDHVEVQLTDATHGTMRIVSQVAERDETYETRDGGTDWKWIDPPEDTC
jgi:hypothetical protein